jgi:protein-disulfide isomerase
MKRYLPFIIIAVVLVGGVGAFLALSKKARSGTPNSAFAGATPGPAGSSAAAAQVSPALEGMTRPNVKVSSPVLVEEYGDYQCPPCGILYPELKKIEREYGDQVRFVFHHFPLVKIHRNALAAAHAAEAARLQGKFHQMHDLLYGNQSAWKDLEDPRPTFVAYANSLGLNVERFRTDMESTRVDQAVATDLQRGQSAGVTGTPTVFIEGYMLRYEATNFEGIRRGINVMLEKKAAS